MPGELPDLKSSFGPRLKRIRDAYGLSQAGLGRLAGLAKGTIQQLEQGRSPPRLDSARKLARAFQISINALIGDPEPPKTRRAILEAQVLGEVPSRYGAPPSRRDRIIALLPVLDEVELGLLEKLLLTYERERPRSSRRR